MQPEEPKMPFSESGEKPSKFKRPELSDEHMNDIAELSANYLKLEAAEFSEEDLVSNLKKLYEMSLSPGMKMDAKHAKRIHRIADAILTADSTNREKLMKKSDKTLSQNNPQGSPMGIRIFEQKAKLKPEEIRDEAYKKYIGHANTCIALYLTVEKK